MNYYRQEIGEVLKNIESTNEGLTNKEAAIRLEKDGPNMLPTTKRKSILKIIFEELTDPIVLLLIVAIIASFIVNEPVDAIAIIFIVLIDLVMGTYQENKANKTADSLAKMVEVKVNVLRDNKQVEIDAKDVVVGDVMLLESGDKVSADGRILECHNLMVDEAILTGESLQVEKNSAVIAKDNVALADQINMVFSGTTIVKGRAKVVVIATALNTQIGTIAKSIHETKEEKSPLTLRVEKFSKQISLLILVVAAIIAILLISKGVSYHEVFLSVIALAVSAMPEGLPLALTMALTIASNKMAKNNVIAKKLHSVESLGSCTVIASDKTGTLTVNEQTAKKIVFPDNEIVEVIGTGYEVAGEIKVKNNNKVLELGLLGAINNEAQEDNNNFTGDSIDIAFLVLGKKLNVKLDNINILETIPYESENKYSAVFYEQEDKVYCTVKGSLETVLSFCDNYDVKTLKKQNENLASSGYRVIALASGEIAKKNKYGSQDIKSLDYKGMVGFIDPIRKEAIKSIKECKSAGIKVLMITGDHPLTAFSIAKDLDLTANFSEVTTGDEVSKYLQKSSEEFDEFVKNKRVFSRVTPIQKLEIVNSLKRQGEFVAVTGDGVNDAPALKTANIGISMGSGTDIARETSKMILLDDNFKSIVAGIKEGRIAYSNIRKIIYFLISCGLAEVLFFCLSIAFDLPMPLIAIQLLWLNVVTDGIQDFALSFERGSDDIMNQKPRSPQEALFDKSLMQEIIVAGLTIGLVVFAVWVYLIKFLNMDVYVARGYIMALMVFIQNIHVFNCRSEQNSAFKVPLKSNKLIVYGVLVSVLLQVIVMESDVLSKFLHTSSINPWHLILLVGIALIVLLIMEVYKDIRKRVKSESI